MTCVIGNGAAVSIAVTRCENRKGPTGIEVGEGLRLFRKPSEYVACCYAVVFTCLPMLDWTVVPADPLAC